MLVGFEKKKQPKSKFSYFLNFFLSFVKTYIVTYKQQNNKTTILYIKHASINQNYKRFPTSKYNLLS